MHTRHTEELRGYGHGPEASPPGEVKLEALLRTANEKEGKDDFSESSCLDHFL
ncbi:hypothetical protein EGR_01869 [Echinococcus granulosus]|uniref:Uncharacterized protein n=1 Tax=Echinococcus granulosus TaxID=6210 RepID=W6UQ63_ECHGR|nr:hypothetical protein EGR_01869 [Echinococcus granulosus]EUB63378.1 hypothetical protein EGR_01869 [Echinococcus granulosus]